MRLIQQSGSGKMRNMSNIPKLPAHTKQQSSCRSSSVKVAAHNKEVSESALTLQWLCCPAATGTHSSPHTGASRAVLLCVSRVVSR
ncbi:hypothetical protein ABVT39_005892 [Epinephelus coioides]